MWIEVITTRKSFDLNDSRRRDFWQKSHKNNNRHIIIRRPPAPPRAAMLDLPGFYWDEEKQRYFALQQEHVARSLQQ